MRAEVTWNANGFWQGDLYDGEADEPSDFFTTRKGATRDAAVTMAFRRWPHAVVNVIGQCGECDDGTDDDGAVCAACDGTGNLTIAC